MTTIATSHVAILVLLAEPRPATAALAQIRNSDLNSIELHSSAPPR
jgi:hypothetical protein